MSLLNDFQSIHTELYAWVVFVGIMALGAAIMTLIFAIILRNEKTYKQGQIDAINGKIFYEKIENEDKETIWSEID